MSDAKRVVEDILADPELRARLAARLREEAGAPPAFWSNRAKPFLAGLSSAAVVLLAFLVPSLEELHDRWQMRQAVDRYAQIGEALMREHQYTAAVAALDRAIELGGAQRMDLMALRMQAHVQRMEEDPEWPGEVPESLTESDFLYVLASDRAPEKAHDRAAALAAYAVFLAGAKRPVEAEHRLREALAIEPGNADLHVLLGNVLGDRQQEAASEAEYREALRLAPANPKARYNLGLVLAERADWPRAEEQFRAYVGLRPADAQGYLRLAEALDGLGRAAEAKAARARAGKLEAGTAPAVPE